jgi:hypothetical protein
MKRASGNSLPQATRAGTTGRTPAHPIQTAQNSALDVYLPPAVYSNVVRGYLGEGEEQLVCDELTDVGRRCFWGGEYTATAQRCWRYCEPRCQEWLSTIVAKLPAPNTLAQLLLVHPRSVEENWQQHGRQSQVSKTTFVQLPIDSLSIAFTDSNTGWFQNWWIAQPATQPNTELWSKLIWQNRGVDHPEMQIAFRDLVDSVCLRMREFIDVTITLTLDSSHVNLPDRAILVAPFQTDENWSEWYVLGPMKASHQDPSRVIRVQRTWSFRPINFAPASPY